MRATLFDVCKKTGVSTATVSRVMNGSPLVHERTRRKVLDAARELGYRPSHAARTLARQKTETLGVIFPQIESGFYTQVLRGIDEVAAASKFYLMTAFAHSDADERELVNRFLRETMVDALILLNLSLPERFIRQAARSGLPVVLVDRPVTGTNLFSISLNNTAGATAAMQHLFKQGHRRVALLRGPRDTYDADQRAEASLAAAEAAGLPVPGELVWQGDFSEESGRAAMQTWLASGQPLPDAIFAHNDEMAIGARSALRASGHHVPQSAALVGFDDGPLARHLDLTSVRSPMDEMGQTAARVAIEQILGSDSAKQRILDVELVVRASSRNERGDRS